MTRHHETNAAFLRWVRQRILRMVSSGVRDFATLAQAVGSIHPRIMYSELRHLTRLEGKARPELAALLSTVHQQPSFDSREKTEQRLPICHPLDYDWRFTGNTITYLFGKCLEMSQDNAPLLLLGCPSVAMHLVDRPISHPVVVIDNNEACLRVIREALPGATCLSHDLLNIPTLSHVNAAVTLLDPPWYTKHMSSFLYAASLATRLHGVVLTSLPPRGTRPGVQHEVQQLLETAETFGLRLTAIHFGVLQYVTPLFELNSLMAAGIRAVPMDWRIADLAILTRDRTPFIQPPPADSVALEWAEISIGPVRLRIKRQNASSGSASKLVSLLKGDICPSGRSAAIRQKADLWTSGNRVFSCHGHAELVETLQAMRASDQMKTGSSSGPSGACSSTLYDQLRNLVAVEYSEHSRYLNIA